MGWTEDSHLGLVTCQQNDSNCYSRGSMHCRQFVAFMCNEVGHNDPFGMMPQEKKL